MDFNRPYVYQEYPLRLYHPSQESVQVLDAEAEAAARAKGWMKMGELTAQGLWAFDGTSATASVSTPTANEAEPAVPEKVPEALAEPLAEEAEAPEVDLEPDESPEAPVIVKRGRPRKS